MCLPGRLRRRRLSFILNRCTNAASRFAALWLLVPFGCRRHCEGRWAFGIDDVSECFSTTASLTISACFNQENMFYFLKIFLFWVWRCFWYRTIQNAFNNKMLKRQNWCFSTLFVHCVILLSIPHTNKQCGVHFRVLWPINFIAVEKRIILTYIPDFHRAMSWMTFWIWAKS